MGRRREAKANFGRSKAKRDVYEKLLIVCEDSCTAPNYLNDHIRSLNLPRSVYARATGESDPTPNKVVEFALSWLEEEKRIEGFGEHKTTVFCVIDRDEHATFDAALERIDANSRMSMCRRKNVTIKCFPSYPCFELWYLLHFKKTRKAYHRVGSKSPADALISDLKAIEEFSDYDKSSKGHYQRLSCYMENALKNAAWSKNDAAETGSENSSTDVHELIVYLNQIKERIEEQKRNSRS